MLGFILALNMITRAACMLLGGLIVGRLLAQQVLVIVDVLRAGIGAMFALCLDIARYKIHRMPYLHPRQLHVIIRTVFGLV
jgi:hypothetical protein